MMTKKLYSESNFGDIADAIRDKGGEGEYTVAEMGDAVRNLATSGDVLNGIIEQYKAKTGTISADTFVEFVNGSLADGIGTGTDTKISPDIGGYAYRKSSATFLPSGDVFITYFSDATLYGALCYISEDDTIDVSSAIKLSTVQVSYTYGYVSTAVCDTDKVFVAFQEASTSYPLRGIVCTISGATITPGATTTLVTPTYAVADYDGAYTTLVSENTVFIAHRMRHPDNNRYSALYGIVCTISGTTITVGTDTLISSATYLYTGSYDISMPVVPLTTNKAFLAYGLGSSYSYLYGIVCTISGTTITVGTETQLSSVLTSGSEITATQVNSSTVFVAHRSSNYAYGVVCTISGTTITTGTDTQLSTYTYSYLSLNAVFTNSKVFFAYNLNDYLYGQICSLSGTTITVASGVGVALSGDRDGTDAILDSYQARAGVVRDPNSAQVFVFCKGDGISTFLHGIFCTVSSSGVAIAAPNTRISRGVGGDGFKNATAIRLDDNRVFITHNGERSALYGIVCTISGSTILPGEDTLIQNIIGSSQYSCPVLLESGKVLVFYRSSTYYHYGVICTISGTTVASISSAKKITSGNATSAFSAVALDANTVFLAYRKSSYLYGIVCTISGTTITVGTETQLSDSTSSYEYTRVAMCDSSHVLITHRMSSYLYGMVCTISGTTITVGTDTQLSTTTRSYYFSDVVAMSSSKAFAVHQGAQYASYGMVCTISGTTITVGTDTRLNNHDDDDTCIGHVAVLFKPNNVFIAYGISETGVIWGASCSIDGTTITVGANEQLSTGYSAANGGISATTLDSDRVFVGHRGGDAKYESYLYSVVVTGGKVVQPSTTKVEGLTAGECTTSTAGDVWVLDTNVSS